MKKVVMMVTLTACIVVMLLTSCPAWAATWGAFKGTEMWGVTVVPDPPEAGANKLYTVTLASDAWVKYVDPLMLPGGLALGTEYQIAWIQGFYLQSTTGANTLYAVPSTISPTVGWTWDTNPGNNGPFNVVGWRTAPSPGGHRINPGASEDFTFESLSGDLGDYGYHTGLEVAIKQDGTVSTATLFVKDSDSAVPEASTLTLGALGLLAPMGFALRRKRTS